MPDAPTLEQEAIVDAVEPAGSTRSGGAVSLREIGEVLARRRRFVLWMMIGPLAACLLYSLVAPDEYEAQARVALRANPVSTLSLDASGDMAPGAFASGDVQLETLANVFRSDALAWSVIQSERLYQAPGFRGNFGNRFAGFRPEAPGPEAQAYLLERFHKRLSVETLPRTLIVQIRFRSRDAALSAQVVNALTRTYREQDVQSRVAATSASATWLDGQLQVLKSQIDDEKSSLMAFERGHGLLESGGQPGLPQTASSLEIDELGRDLAAATADRMLREAEYHAAQQGDPEMVMAADQKLGGGGASALVLIQQLHGHRSELEEEQAQLSLEHGPNFPRVMEIRGQLADIDRQTKSEDEKLVERFRDAWKIAADRETLAKANLDRTTKQVMQQNEAAAQATLMRAEIDRNHELYMQVLAKREQAEISAGMGNSNVAVIDPARQPVKPASPDLPVYLAITFFVSLWLALGGVFLIESVERPRVPGDRARVVVVSLLVFGMMLAASRASAQAPTPSTSGLPTGVARIPQSTETKTQPNAKDAPTVWGVEQEIRNGVTPIGVAGIATTAPVPIGAGDMLDVSESHMPGVHTVVRVSGAGTIALPLAGEVQIGGMNETAAARAIEAALVQRGMLLHPQVNLLVTAYAGRDVSVLGEVARPGVYAYSEHHRLLDLISAASGLTPAAGRLVTIVHREDQGTPHVVVLDQGADSIAEHNPELKAGDTVQVSRAGLVYVIGDVIRPGGFPVDPLQRLTVVKALALAWGPGQNAALSRGLLIREQKDGRTLTTLNLKRLLRGQDPDLPIEDHDILFVPDSTAKNLWNRSMESVIQSAAGVSIYAGLVYSQRF